MSAWAMKDATRTWDSVFDRAWAGEPQFVSRDGARTVVIVSLQAYESAHRPSNHSILDVLRRCPVGDDGISPLLDDETAQEIPSSFVRAGEFSGARS